MGRQARRRISDLHAKRGKSLLEEAIRTGRMTHADEEAAADVLAANIQGVARQSRRAQLYLAQSCLAQLSPSATPSQLGSVPRAEGGEATPEAFNSNNFLLPSVRPRPPTPGTVRRKRRRTITSGGDENGVGGGGGGGSGSGGQEVPTYRVARPAARLASMGGVDGVVATVRELTEWPLMHPEIYAHLGAAAPRGILLHGPPGCGKTLLAHAVAGELGVPFLRVSGPEIVSSMSGESERKLRALFDEAKRLAPAIVFIDEIDAIASRKEGATKDMERRIVSQLLSCLGEDDESEGEREREVQPDKAATDETMQAQDDHNAHDDATMEDADETKDNGEDNNSIEDAPPADVDEAEVETEQVVKRIPKGKFIVIAATNRPENIEPALRRAGRFDREIELGAPDEDGRAAILRKLMRKLRLAEDVDFEVLAKRTAGCVGADLDLLVREGGMCAVRRFARGAMEAACDGNVASGSSGSGSGGFHSLPAAPFTSGELAGCAVTMEDLLSALDTIQPSALREGFAVRPDVTWADVGALEHVRRELSMAVVEPIRRRALFDAVGLTAPAGVLLYGPPGCGKTLLARAVAAASGANFISVKGPELLSRYVGDSELAVRRLFARARASAPAVIFFDELDALAPRRGGGRGGGDSGASERVVNQLLTEMDGFADRREVFLVAATNRPDIIDPAMLRPGRLDKLLYVPLPGADGRVQILRTLAKRIALAHDVDLEKTARDTRCDGLSGADLGALLRGACEAAVGEALLAETNAKADGQQMDEQTPPLVHAKHVEKALSNVVPSVSARDARRYAAMEAKLRSSRATLEKEGNEEEGGKVDKVAS